MVRFDDTSTNQIQGTGATSRLVVLAVGFVLCLVGIGGLAMDDMGSHRVGDGRFTSAAVVKAASGAEHQAPLPAAWSGALLALGVSVTLASAARRA